VGVEDVLMDPRNPMPPDLSNELRELQRRLETLERSPRLTSASIDDEDGNTRVVLGRLAEDGSFGIEVFDTDGNRVFAVDEVGLTHPRINVPYRKASDLVGPITSGSFIDTWEAALGVLTGDSVRFSCLVATDAGTTAEARLEVPQLGLTSAVRSIAAGNSSVTSTWTWKPPLPIGEYGSGLLIQLQVRRASGAGNVYSYAPSSLWIGNGADIDATATGV
jgi:hypothetical protein